MVKVTLKDTPKWKKILENVKKLQKNPYAKVGVLGKAGLKKEEEGMNFSGLTVAQVATFNEFGTVRNGKEHIPPRPFLRGTIEEKRQEIIKLAITLHQKILDGFDVERATKILGSSVSGMVKARIAEGIKPLNAVSTILKKQSDKPLIDTGQLRQSISYEAVMEGGSSSGQGSIATIGENE